MTKNEIFNTLITLKPKLKKEGITLLGVFGSYARGDYTSSSDVDILYEIDNAEEFANKNGGFGAFTKLKEIKDNISSSLGMPIDFTSKGSLNEVGKKYILGDLVNV